MPQQMDPRIAARRKTVQDDRLYNQNFSKEAQARRQTNAKEINDHKTKLYRDLHGDEAFKHMQEAKKRHTAKPEVGSLNMIEPETVSHNDTRYSIWDHGKDDQGNHYMTTTGAGTQHFVRKPSGKLHFIPGEVHSGHTVRTDEGKLDPAGTQERYLIDHHENDVGFKVPHAQHALTQSKTFKNSAQPPKAPITQKPKLSVVKSLFKSLRRGR